MLEDDSNSVFSFNILGKLNGVGRAILLYGIHEMDDVLDIRQFLCSLRCTREVMMDPFFGWAIAKGLSHSYSLRSVPNELTEIVCFCN